MQGGNQTSRLSLGSSGVYLIEYLTVFGEYNFSKNKYIKKVKRPYFIRKNE